MTDSKVLQAAKLISPVVWGTEYVPGEGPLHHAGGSYWYRELLRRADEWNRLAWAARVVAGALPDGE